MTEQSPIPEGIAGVEFQGPFSVGRYAKFLQQRFREISRVQIHGEVWNFRNPGRAKVYFELRDGDGALQCSMWRDAFEEIGLPDDALVDGTQIVAAGGPDFYPGSRTSSSSFSFAVTGMRVAGEGDLLMQLEILRKTLEAEGLFKPQKELKRAALPRRIGVITGETGKARDDILAGLERRGWAGQLVWAFAPVQDRHAAGAISERLRDLSAAPVDVIIVARGGGSLADLFAFCDEELCRTVALLSVPVIASVGHHTDRMLIDDVAACRCSTPTHAAEEAVPLSPTDQRESIARIGRGLEAHGNRAVLGRARHLGALARGPAQHLARHNARLHQQLRELRAGGRRRVDTERTQIRTRGLVLQRKTDAMRGPELTRRRATLESLASALAAHDPDRTLQRGYAIVTDSNGAPVESVGQAKTARDVTVKFADGKIGARIEDEND
jgi:exodeoxyribonuclease VII large subunit